MENMRRSIKLFFAIYGGLLFQIIGAIVLFLFILKGVNYLYKENSQPEIKQNVISEQEKLEKQEELKKEEEDILFISEFLDNCNDKNIMEAYKFLSEECKNEKYKTIEEFENEYVNKLFTRKKDYEIEKQEDLYKVTIMDDILETGSIENRKSTISYYKIKEDILEKTIYIER